MRKLLLQRSLGLLLAAFLCAFAIAGAQTSDLEQSMLENFKEAGDVPEEIINPPSPVPPPPDGFENLRRFFLEHIMGFRITYGYARGKACFANQRVIYGAVEMYNMDHNKACSNLIDSDVTDSSGTIVSGGYLKGPVTRPDANCEYRSYGNLATNGIVYCTYHGTIHEYQEALIKISGRVPDYIVSQRRTNQKP